MNVDMTIDEEGKMKKIVEASQIPQDNTAKDNI